MTGSSWDGRSGNKLYGWLKRKQSSIAKKRIGEKNGSFGRRWYYDPVTKKNGKFLEDEVPEGWVKGRKIKPNKVCLICGEDTGSTSFDYCDEHKGINKRIAQKRYQKFLNSDHKSIRSFAKSIGVSQATLSMTWKKHIPEYGISKTENGKSYKSSGKLYGTANG